MSSSIYLYIESSASKHPLSNLIVMKNMKTVKDWCRNPITIKTLKDWREWIAVRTEITSIFPNCYQSGFLTRSFKQWTVRFSFRDQLENVVLLTFNQIEQECKIGTTSCITFR